MANEDQLRQEDSRPPQQWQPAEKQPYLRPAAAADSDRQSNQAPTATPYKLDEFSQAQAPGDSNASAALLRKIPVTTVLIAANCAVFLTMAAVSGGQSFAQPTYRLLLDFGADFGPLTLSGQYFRLLTNMFVHIGILHIAMNMYALWIIGELVEQLFGSSKFLFLYLVAGVGGALTSLFFNPQILSAGASGAVFGAYGSLLAFVRVNAKHYPPAVLASVTRTVVILLIFNLAFGFSRPGIDNACHIGGFLTGVAAGALLAPPHPSIKGWTVPNILKASLIIAVLLAALVLDKLAFAG